MVEEQRINKKLWGVIVVTTLLFLMIASVLFLENNRTVKDNILNKNFITVQKNYRYSVNKVSFDLKNKSFVNLPYGEAIKDGKFYYGYKHVIKTGNEEFELRKEMLLAYPLIATKITQKEIKKHNFTMNQQVPKNYQSKLKKLEPNCDNTKIKVTYNSQYLPVKLELYNTVSKRWKIYRKYFYLGEKAYKKDLKECLEAILHGQYGED